MKRLKQKQCNHATCQGSTCRRPKQPKPRKRLNPVSKKQGKRNREYSKERKQFLEENPFCQFPDCEKESTDVHHAKGRGKYLMDTKTWKALCREHHKDVEEKPFMAKELGLSESRLKVNQ